jgi:hypothetical protein
LNPIPDRCVTQKLVDAEVEKIVQARKRWRGIEEILIECRDRTLPAQAIASSGLSEWQLKALRAAGAAIGKMRDGAPLAEIRAVGKQAVEPITGEFEAHQAAQTDIEWRDWITRWTRLPDGLTEPAKELATTAIREALAKLPLGTPRPKLDEAVEAALEPFRLAVAQLRAEAFADQQRIQDAANRQSMITTLHWAVPWGSGFALTPEAREAVAKALDALPRGTPQRQLEEARTAALAPFLAAHAQQQQKARLVRDGLRAVYQVLVSLEANWDYENDTPESLAHLFQKPIRAALEKQLTGQEQPEQVARLVRRLVRAQLEATPAPARA